MIKVKNEIIKRVSSKCIISDDINLLKTTIGVFVNLMADNKSRTLFKDSEGLPKLIKILDIYGQDDWSLSMLICQVMWNYCIETTNLFDLISDSEMQSIMGILVDYLGKLNQVNINKSLFIPCLLSTMDIQ